MQQRQPRWLSSLTAAVRRRFSREPERPALRVVGEAELDAGPEPIDENLTARGVDLLALPAGALLHLGATAVEVTGLGGPCRRLERVMRALLAGDGDDRDAAEAEVQQAPVDADRLDFEGAFTFAPIGIALIGLDGRFLRVNPAFCEITRYAPEELLGKAVRDITHPDDVGADAEQVARLLGGETRSSQLEKRYIDAQGHIVWALVFRSLARDEQGTPQHFIAQVMDVSERKHFERELRDLADRDPLTGLRNRRRFEDDLHQQLGRTQRYGEQAALLMIDLDGFKRLNDTRGHQAGDQLLRAVASALRERLRATDLIARIGGDEFAVLLPHVDMRRAARVAGEIATAVAECSTRAGDGRAQVTASVGTAFIDRNAGSADAVLEQADQAMYATKHARQRNGAGRAEAV